MEQGIEVHIPRVMIAAASSGSGKTLLTCGLLDVLSRRGVRLRACKCGPDYIDPMFHREVLGIESTNLDPFFCGADELQRILCHGQDAYTLAEGVMGIYDGLSADSRSGSCYDVAEMTETPILLAVNASGVGRTVISQIKGILADDERQRIRGLLLNRISAGFYEKLKPCLERELAESGYGRVCLLGGIPTVRDITLESRHLGLRMPGEIRDIRGKIRQFGEVMEQHCDVEGILRIMEAADALIRTDEGVGVSCGSDGDRPLIAVAKDEAFCFYYRENLELLEQAGARIEFFSPIHDRSLPEGTTGLLLGGGYPELHLEELSKNSAMLDAVRSAIQSGMPSIAECGGFMYLHRTVRDTGGTAYPLVGVIDGACENSGHPVRFGYLQLAGDGAPGNRAFGESLTGLKGHEFHYYDSTACGNCCLAEKPVSKERFGCMICDDRRMWGFPHFYYGSHTAWLRGFVKAAKEFEHG